MEGRNRTLNGERPIAKPRFPLPQVFDRTIEPAELLIESVPLKDQRAYFYQKEGAGSGSPVYGFFITSKGSDVQRH